MAKAEAELELDVGGGEPKKGGGMKKILILALAALLLVGIGVGVALFLLGGKEAEAPGGAETAAAEPAPEPKKTAYYYDLNPAFIVNLDDDSGVRFLQVTVSLMSYDPDALEKVKANLPLVRHNLTLLFSSQRFEEIKTREGKERLQQEALKTVRDALTEVTGEPLVDALYLPSIVGQ